MLIAGLPLQLWLGTQLLLFSSGLFFGLLAVLAGMAMPRAQGGVGMVVVLLLTYPITFAGSRFSLTNFLMPIYPAVYMFHPGDVVRWGSWVDFYGVKAPPLAYTLILQVIFGCLMWRGTVRKFDNPNQPAFARPEILGLYGLLVFFQYGLVWEWRSSYPAYDYSSGLCAVHGCLLFLGAVMLTPQLLHPEKARIAAVRHGAGAYRWILWKSGPCTAIAVTAIACAGFLTQYVPGEPVWRYLIASANTLVVFLTFSLLLEICRLMFRRRAIGFFALALFVLYVLPFLLSLTFDSSIPMRFSVVAPGIAALAGKDFVEDMNYFDAATVVHVGIVIALACIWASYWQRWLARATVTSQV